MKQLFKRSPLTLNPLSLFFTLFCSFLIIILLLVSFNAVSYSFFRDRIKDEIIGNSGLNLHTTVTNYEKHMKLIRSLMLNHLFNNDTQILQSSSSAVYHDTLVSVQKELRNTMSNTQLHLDNFIYFFTDTGMVLDKDGSRNADTMFSKFYIGEPYNAEFWKQQSESGGSFKIYPSTVFRSHTVFESTSHGELMPILIKSSYDNRLAFILLLKSTQAYQDFHQPKPGSSLFILDERQQIIYASSGDITLPARIVEGPIQDYIKIDNTYYFMQQGTETGLIYVEAVSDRGLAAQMRNLNMIMFSLLALSILLSIGISYVIARRFQHPLARIIQALHSSPTAGSLGSRIKEFQLLHTKIQDLFRSNTEIRMDLQAKNSMLQQFAYMSRLKKIARGSALRTSLDMDKPYRLILFQLTFKERFMTEISSSPHRAFNMYLELIDAHFSSIYEESLTFQPEKDQILTILFVNDRDSQQQDDTALAHLVAMMDNDAAYCNFTIAPSPIRKYAVDFSETYHIALDLIRQRKLGEDVQVITELQPYPALHVPGPSEESELIANLQAGNDAVTIPLVARMLEQLERSGATALQFQEFSRDLVNRTMKMMYAHNVPMKSLTDGKTAYGPLKACYTLAHYKQFFQDWLSQSAQAIQQKKAETDAITQFVTDYVAANYGGDLSLEVIADKLGITGPYLSSYFKEKSGTNFSDYIYKVRMSKAQEMLLETDMLIQEIASLVGYFTVASFNRVFKKYTGMTPSQYRRHHKT